MQVAVHSFPLWHYDPDPTFVLRRQASGGLFPLSNRTLAWLWEQRTEL